MKKQKAITDSPKPVFHKGFCVPDRCIGADELGRLWFIDPKKGTVTPVKVKP